MTPQRPAPDCAGQPPTPGVPRQRPPGHPSPTAPQTTRTATAGRSRYIEVDGFDVGLVLINEGLAIARFDSRDGFGTHNREAAYVRADDASANCVEPPPPPPPTPPPATSGGGVTEC